MIKDPDPTDVIPTTMPVADPCSLEQAGVATGNEAGGGEQERHPQGHKEVGADGSGVAQGPQHEDPRECRGDRPDAEPLDELEIDRACAQVHQGADRLHDRGCDQVAGDRGERGNPEEQDQHRGHQRPATHAGQADHDSDAEAGGREEPVDLHSGCSLRNA